MWIISMILLAGSLGGLAWMLSSQWVDPLARALRDERLDRDDQRVKWDLGPTLPRSVYALLRIVAGALGCIVVLVITHNAGEGIVLGFLASTLPGAMLDRMRSQRRAVLDTQAYTLANSLRLLLPISDNVVAALEDASHTAEDPLRRILVAALQTEMRVTGTVTEFLRQVGHDLNLGDFMLMGDILGQVRTQTVRASSLLDNLVVLWGQRLQTEQRRLGRISGSARLGTFMILISILIQVGWPLISVTARAADGRLIGQIFGFFAALITAAAWLMLRNQTRRALNQ